MAEPLPGWEQPVFRGMADPVMFHGVPLMFGAFDLLGTLFAGLCLSQMNQVVYALEAVLVGGLAYVAMRIGCAIEPRWLQITWEYLTYSNRYEG